MTTSTAARDASAEGEGHAREASDARPVDRAAHPYRMKDLCEKTGLPRQAIHFYIQQGLVPEGHKTGRNMAYYGEEHVARILLVRRLQHERFLPLKAIRAVIDARDEVFAPAQRAQLAEIKAHLAGTVVPVDPQHDTVVDVDALASQLGLERRDVDELVEIGLLGVSEEGDARRILDGDAWILRAWADLRDAGFGRALGFSPRDLAVYEEAVDAMFDREAKLLADRLQALAPEQAASMVARALPVINAFLVRYHLTKARNFFAAL